MVAGATGYGNGTVLRTVRKRYGAPDVAHIPIGAYEPRWFMAAQHANPAGSVRILQDVGAQRALGIHWGTFHLTDEAQGAPASASARAPSAAGIDPDRFIAAISGSVHDC